MKIKLANVQITITAEIVKTAKPESSDSMYIELNNTYLGVERGSIILTSAIKRRLENLVWSLYSCSGEGIEIRLYDHWIDELQKLPGWRETYS